MIRTIVIEGQDQIGKADTTANIIETLSRAGNEVFTTYYPFYALPFGTLVRLLLTGDKRLRQIEELDHIWNTPRQLEVSGVMLALNRLETLSGIDATVTDSAVLVLDRGPYSMCVTTAYGLSEQLIELDEVDSYLDKFLDIDSAFRSHLDTDNAIIQLKSEGEIKVVNSGDRKDKDLYEVNSVQMLTRDVYDVMSQRFDNWVQVVSRYDEDKPKWRDRNEILGDALQHLKGWGFEVEPNGKAKIEHKIIDISDASLAQYNVELTRSDIILWRDSHSKRDENSIHSSSIRIGNYIAREVKKGAIMWPEDVKDHVSRLLSEYPEILILSEGIFGKDLSDAIKVSVS